MLSVAAASKAAVARAGDVLLERLGWARASRPARVASQVDHMGNGSQAVCLKGNPAMG